MINSAGRRKSYLEGWRLLVQLNSMGGGKAMTSILWGKPLISSWNE